MTEPVLAVVDPFSSGYFLAEEIHRRGIQCVAVRSLRDERHLLPAHGAALFRDFIEHHELESTTARLRELGVHAVIAGCEPAVELTDALAASLGLRGNSVERSAARRNKYEMHQALREAGLRHIEQIRTADIDHATQWASRRKAWPVVVKPLASAGTDGVHICPDKRAVVAAFRSILGRTNIYGAPNSEVVIQQYMAGTEYVVDAVLRDGSMTVAAIWRYSKQATAAGAPIYRYIEVVPYEGPRQERMVAYARQAVQALEVENGPVHVELMWTGDADGPVLIEAAARMHGGMGAVIPKLTCGANQVDLTIDAYTTGRHFGPGTTRGYCTNGHLVELFLISRREGHVAGYPINELLPRLESYAAHHIWLREDRLRVTNDLWSSPGIVVLHHEDHAVVGRDIERIVAMEESGALFELAGREGE